ncbi:hypothetical protein IFM89_030094 [Coptis chinensis]|uniref:Protein LTV1 homolog n=1 Tax=Coptis chinensis TaxID=261450 RepID=A0A835ICS5_9MAGN|nr:hypothetical protein IFM89_030094 [Coptis chinensis]
MGKKKFIDKKKSATFQLLARDSADPKYDQGGPSADRVFTRVDNNYSYSNPDEEDPDSIFADADDEDNKKPVRVSSSTRLPDNIRKEILELGFPDDGYNYLLHLREIKNSGAGSAYYENTKAKLDHQLSLDVKAYDASRVNVSGIAEDFNDNSIYGVAAKTVGVKIHKVVDPEVSALLDYDSDMSRFGSDVEDLEEDFVVQANVLGGGLDEKINVNEECIVSDDLVHDLDSLQEESKFVQEKPRVRRLLDEQFDMLTLQEYETESDSELDGSVVAEDESLADKLIFSLKGHVKDELELDGKYKVPADIMRENEGSKNGEAGESAAKLIRRCVEYGEMCDNDDDEVVLVEESSDESELWDCETIVSTYSNLDNHPGKIEVPRIGTHVITLRGKQKLPVDNVKEARGSRFDKLKKKRHGDESKEEKNERKSVKQQGVESKEEKKQRKAAVKEERREARRAKKEMKGIYRCEGQHAQKVAAFSGPSAIHLM